MEDITKGKVETHALRIEKTIKGGKLVFWNKRIYFIFPYWPALNAAIKNMAGYKYHGFDDKNPQKMWSVEDNARNSFTLEYYRGLNPYAKYENPLITIIDPGFGLRKHQQEEFVPFLVDRPGCILAGEMGTGKTLAFYAGLSLMQLSGLLKGDVWYVAPKSVLRAVKYEITKWRQKAPIPQPRFMTYDELTKTIRNWVPGTKGPQVAIFDESSRLKTPKTQRSQAAFQLAEGVRQDWGDAGRVWLATGTPSPKSPNDWWMQAEIACPGYLAEGDIFKFQNRLAINVKATHPITGQTYYQIKGWKDGSKKCGTCGKTSIEHVHEDHPYAESKNEVLFLYERLKGLVLVKFKKDCIDLPDKVYDLIRLEPNPSVIGMARFLKNTCPSAMEAMIRLRCLSDGFQYTQTLISKKTCEVCKGTGKLVNPTNSDEWVGCGCEDGQVPVYEDSISVIPTPKDELFLDLLDEYEDHGRFVTFAAFTASIDKLCDLARKADWHVLRIDGRGWQFTTPANDVLGVDALVAFQDEREKYSKIVVIGHPDSAGMGLTLTASVAAFYYSNGFNAEGRIQSEDRIHRMGMDVNLGARIIDCVNLPTDELVLKNLKEKRDLQKITMGDLFAVIGGP